MGLGSTLKKAGRVAAGWSTGGLSEAFRGNGSTTVDQVPLETPEQRAAKVYMAKFMKDGKFGASGENTVGEGYKGSLGDFSMTGAETAGMGRLSQVLAGDPNNLFGMGEGVLKDLLSTEKYNPLNADGASGAYRAEAARNIDEMSSSIKRNQAFSGSLYGSGTGRQISHAAEGVTTSLNSKLGDMYQNYVNQKIGGATTGANMELSKIDASQTYGALPRTLANNEAQAKMSEWLRSRSESLLPLQTAGTLSGQNTPFGVPSVTTQNPNPWMDLLNTVVAGGSRIIASK